MTKSPFNNLAKAFEYMPEEQQQELLALIKRKMGNICPDCYGNGLANNVEMACWRCEGTGRLGANPNGLERALEKVRITEKGK